MKYIKLRDYFNSSVTVKFLPNVNDIKKSVIVHRYKATSALSINYKYYSYVYVNGEFTFMPLFQRIYNIFSNIASHGVWCDKNDFIFFQLKENYEKNKYYNIDEKNKVTFSQDKIDEKSELIKNYKHINLFDLFCEYAIEIFPVEREGFVDYTIKIKKIEPLYVKENLTEVEKENIYSKYKAIGTLEDFISFYENEINIKHLSDTEVDEFKREYFSTLTRK